MARSRNAVLRPKRSGTTTHPTEIGSRYKGRLIADLPGHYLGWFAREGFPKGELGTLIGLMYELDHKALTHPLDPLRKRK
jgi:uncharacterized protein (DUF3820 family)